MDKDEKRSDCCDAKIDIHESGVSQLSFDLTFTCSSCGKVLNLKPLDVRKNW